MRVSGRDANREIDPEEPLLSGMSFSANLAGGGGFGGETSEGQCAFVTIPSGLPLDEWPVMARMVAPEDSSYKAVGPLEMEPDYPATRAESLFAPK